MKRYQKKSAVSSVGRFASHASGKRMDHRSWPNPLLELEAMGSSRLAWGALAVGVSAVLCLAAALEPNPSGMGTHTQLGLPPCGFLYWTGLPCPGCGLTTSFAHMARLELSAAFAVQPVGVLLFALCVLALPVCLGGCVRAWPVHATMSRLRTYPIALGVALLALLNWCARLAAMWLA